jgi:hypothetical protein
MFVIRPTNIKTNTPRYDQNEDLRIECDLDCIIYYLKERIKYLNYNIKI